jgi:peptide/nickel transport system permease protein
VKTYLIRRLLLIVPTFLGISVLTFLVVQLSPGNPLLEKLRRGGEGGIAAATIPPEYVAQMKKLYGLDKPIPVRYAVWLRRLVLFDFGDSYKDGRPVITKIRETLPITLQLSIISILLVYLLSIPLGVYSARYQYSWSDTLITFLLFILYSLPSFWVAMLLMYFLGGGRHLEWFPVYGISSQGADQWPWYQWLMDRTWHLALPVFCLTYGGLAGLSRYARAGMINEIRQDYIRTARAYGFSERTVIYKYAMRNSLIPIITLLGTLLPSLIGGSVIIESIFSIPGMGRLTFEAILSRDYPLIMGILSISALLTLLGLILSDILYAVVDPRIRFE